MKAPILVFVYNRLNHTKNLLERLNLCNEAELHDLYIFSDGPKNNSAKESIEIIRGYLQQFSERCNFKSINIREEEHNKGLANSIITGVTNIINQFGIAIILEDDLFVTLNFIEYMQKGLDYYALDERVGAISGFSVPIKCKKDFIGKVYKSKTGNSWGWATWKDIWNQVDWNVKDYEQFKTDKKMRWRFDLQQKDISDMLDRQIRGEIDSWAVRWDYFFFRKGLWTIYPYSSKVVNNGYDGTGVHCGNHKDRKIEKLREESYSFQSWEECENLTHRTSGMTVVEMTKKNIKKILSC